MTKEVSHWPEVHQLIQFVTKHMGEIKELARPGDREKESLDLEKIYLDFQPQDFDGASLMLLLFLDVSGILLRRLVMMILLKDLLKLLMMRTLKLMRRFLEK